MKSLMLTIAALAMWTTAFAQTDPIVMTIGGKPVTRSEFEYSYNKNNSETVVDKKSVAEYVDLFINYKLKVLAAEAAGIRAADTLFIDDGLANVEAAARLGITTLHETTGHDWTTRIQQLL